MVLPEGFALPPLPVLLVLLTSGGVVAWLIRRRPPAFTPGAVLAFVPWMAAGASLHVLHRIGAAPTAIDPFLGTPAVYVTTVIVAAAIWLLGEATGRSLGLLAGSGSVAAVVVIGVVLAASHRIAPTWSVVGIVLSAVVAAIAWTVLRWVRPEAVDATGAVGGLVVFAHTLDGISTAIGVDVLGFSERTPLSRVILEAAATLPTADIAGVGWLFVLVKVGVACAVVTVFVEYVREEPRQANLLFAVIAAVGLGPGVHNLLLYVVR